MLGFRFKNVSRFNYEINIRNNEHFIFFINDFYFDKIHSYKFIRSGIHVKAYVLRIRSEIL